MRPPAEGRAGQEPLGAASDSRACSGDNRAGKKFLQGKETVPCHLVPSAALLCACRGAGREDVPHWESGWSFSLTQPASSSRASRRFWVGALCRFWVGGWVVVSVPLLVHGPAAGRLLSPGPSSPLCPGTSIAHPAARPSHSASPARWHSGEQLVPAESAAAQLKSHGAD